MDKGPMVSVLAAVTARRSRLRWSREAATGTLAAIAGTAIWFGAGGLAPYPRIVLISCVLATIGWIFTRLNDTYIAVVALLATVIAGRLAGSDLPFGMLGDDVIWLMLGAFVIAAAAERAGLLDRLAGLAVYPARSVAQLFYLLTSGLLASAFLIPSTAARAAAAVPIFMGLARILEDRHLIRALALLIPSIILLSAIASLVGAGGNILAADLLAEMTGQEIGFGRWLLLGLPFAVISCFGTTWIILHAFLDPGRRRRNLDRLACGRPPERRGARAAPFLLVLIVLGWSTEVVHKIDAAALAVGGALLLTAPRLGVIDFKEAFHRIEWSLLVFLAATLGVGRAMIDSGAATWVLERAMDGTGGGSGRSPMLVVTVVAALGLLAHLAINSRSARAAILVPPVILSAVSTGLDPAALTFLVAAASGFCLTLQVSAKPVMIFSQLERPTFDQEDLLRLAALLLPFHFLLLIGFALWIWPLLGLPLHLPG